MKKYLIALALPVMLVMAAPSLAGEKGCQSCTKEVSSSISVSMVNGGDLKPDGPRGCTVPKTNYNLAMNHLTCFIQGSGANATVRTVTTTFTREVEVPCPPRTRGARG